MVLKRPVRNILSIAVGLSIAVLVLTYIFLSDFAEFDTPNRIARLFYFYTIALLVYSVLIIMVIRKFDSRSHADRSRLNNYLRISLGSLWLIDGILQIQPEMSFGFAPFVLIPTLQSLPSILQPVAHPLIYMWSSNGSLLDAASATFQIYLGISFLVLKSRKYVSFMALLSFVWALSIWIFGEDMGAWGTGISILTGFPGAALLYSVPSALLFLKLGEKTGNAILAYTLAAVFIISGILQAIPANGFWTAGSIASISGANAYIFEPGMLAHFMYDTATILSNAMIPWNMLLTVSLFAVGILFLMEPFKASKYSMILSVIIWVIGQDFGVFGGYGTDPNTALVIFLLSWSLMLSHKKEKIYMVKEADTGRALLTSE